MKSINLSLFFLAIACTFLSCAKGGDDGNDCEDDNTCTIIYTNTGSIPLRVEVAIQLTPQFVPIDPIITLNLAPGATVTKVVKSNRYFTIWSRDCATSCTMVTYYSKTYTNCEAYDEKQGI